MRLLLTVARPAEVATALAAGADLLDVKDPDRGSLGRPSLALLEEVARACAGRRPLSVPLGDGPHDAEELRVYAERALRLGPAYLKVGLAAPPGGTDAIGGGGEGSAERAGRSLARLARAVRASPVLPRARIVAVTFVDAGPSVAPAPEELPAMAERHGADAVMLDTLAKGAGSTPERMGRERLGRWAADARARGLGTAVAGGLDAGSIPGLRGLDLDVVGVRGGACAGGRRGRLDPDRCRAVRRAVDAASRRAPSPR